MSFKGSLDFQHALQFDLEEVRVYPGFETPDVFVLPDGIGLALKENGSPDLTVTLVKTQQLFSQIVFYGTLDIGLALEYPLEMAVQALRSAGYMAAVIPAVCAGGYLQLSPVNTLAELPEELRSPIMAGWNLAGPTRFLFRLDAGSAVLMKESLLGGVLLFKAAVVLDCKGLAPRLPLSVRFNPREVLSALAGMPASGNRIVTRDQVTGYLGQDPSLLPMTIAGKRDGELPGVFAEAMADRLLERFSQRMPPETGSDKDVYLVDESPDDGVFDWNLDEPVEITRTVRLQLDPLKAAMQLAHQEGGTDSSLEEVMIPTLKLGYKCIHVAANIPAYRPNVIRAGVRIFADPLVPVRMQGISETVDFTASSGSSDIVLRFSPSEPANYMYTPFMLLYSQEGTRKTEGKTAATGREHLVLNSDDFGITIVSIQASPDLLEIATLGVSLDGDDAVSYDINASHPLLSLCFEEEAAQPVLQISAISLSTGAIITLPVKTATSMRVGLHHFMEYGNHTVSICCQTSDPILTLELLPESAMEDAVPELVFFTPGNNCKEWSYFADSPFNCNYRYRFRKEDGSSGNWSALQSPFVPLVLENVNTSIGE